MSKSEEIKMYKPDEHVRERPDTYIEVIEKPWWVFDETIKRMIKKLVIYNPGLEQCVIDVQCTAATYASQSDAHLVEMHKI